jgi:hypothetical protein
VIKFFMQKTTPKKGLNRRDNTILDNRPIRLLKETCHTIMLEGIVKTKNRNGHKNFCFIRNQAKTNIDVDGISTSRIPFRR